MRRICIIFKDRFSSNDGGFFMKESKVEYIQKSIFADIIKQKFIKGWGKQFTKIL